MNVEVIFNGQVMLMRDQKGISLIEVMATITVLAVAILAITFVLQQGTSASKEHENLDRAVMITRTVMEEIKHNLKHKNDVTVFGQTIPLQVIRAESQTFQAPDLYYPNASNQQYRIEIRSESFQQSFEIKSAERKVEDFFRKIKVTTINLQSNRSYELEAYVEYQ